MHSSYQLDLLDLNRLRWMVGNLMAISSLMAVRIMEMVDPLWLLLVVGLVITATLKPRWTGLIPAWLVRVGAPVLITWAVFDFLTSGRDFLPPLVRLIGLLTVLRAVQNRRQREDFQLAVLCLFLVVVSGVFTLSLQFAFQLFLFSPLVIGFLFLSNLLAAREDGDHLDCEWERFRWRVFLGEVFRGLDWRGVGYAGGLMVVFLGMAALIFVGIPRFQWAQSIPFFQVEGKAQTGFSSTVSLGDVTEIAQDNRVAFRVDVGAGSEVPVSPYWRMLTLDRYDGGTFEHSDFGGETRPSRRMEDNVIGLGDIFRIPRGKGVIEEPWTFYFEGGISRYLPLAGPIRNLRFQQDQAVEINPDYFTMALPEPLNSLLFFQVRGVLPTDRVPATLQDRRYFEEVGLEPRWLDGSDRMALRRLEYPESTLTIPISGKDREFLETRVAELFPNGVGDAEAAARRIGEDLGVRHRYSLSSLPVDRDGEPVVNWLRKGAAGHCEYFAGAMILLARTAGIPARMVVGFAGGNWNDYENYFVVRNEHAHAWVEIYSNGTWVRIDPTPGASGMGLAGMAGVTDLAAAGFSIETGFGAWMDSLRVIWYRRVINFDDTDQEEIAERVTGLWADTKAFLRAMVEEIFEWIRELRQRMQGLPFAEVLLAAVLIGGGFLGLVLFRSGRWMLRWVGRRIGDGSGHFFLSRDRREASALLARIEAIRNRKEDGWVEITEPLYREVQAVRFGRVAGTDAARAVLRSGRRATREWGKRTRPASLEG